MFGFRAHAARRGGETTESPAEIRARIQAAYDAGAPFFSKCGLQQIFDAFNSARKSANPCTVPIMGVDGVTVDCRLHTGQVEEDCPAPWVSPDSSVVITKPYLQYRSLGDMTGTPRTGYSFDPDSGYLPMVIEQNGEERDRTAGAIIRHPSFAPKAIAEDFFTSGRAYWEASDTFRRLGAIFFGQTNITLPPRIDKVIGFALGTLTMRYRTEPSRSAVQHALLLSIRDWLLARSGVACYVQDPMCQDADREILGKAGVEVVEDPEGFLKVDETSVVVTFAPGFALREIIADIARPAVIIWAPVEGYIGHHPPSPRVKRMIEEEYAAVDCPFDLSIYSPTQVYVRKV